MELEILEKDKYYHIYNKGINGTEIFKNDRNKTFFLNQFSKYLSIKISIFAYCLMDNLFHFVIRLNDEPEIVTQGFSNFFNSYAKAFNKQNNRTGSLFEKHFKRKRLDDENYLKHLITYVHLNPKHHLNLDFTKFKYSSYQSYLSSKETKLEREEVLELFDGLENFIYFHNQKTDFLNEKYTFE